MKECKNCSNTNWCKILHWFRDELHRTIYEFVNKYSIDCPYYKKKWYLFWIKESENKIRDMVKNELTGLSKVMDVEESMRKFDNILKGENKHEI